MFSTYNAIYSDTLQCDAVVMGSSRGQVQYDVRILDSIAGLNCYNLSVDGRCIDAEVVMLTVIMPPSRASSYRTLTGARCR